MDDPPCYGVWRLRSNFGKGYTFRVSALLRDNLYSYHDSLAYHRKCFVLPQELKDLDRESDTFLSLLLRWFDRYLAYLVEIGKGIRPLVKYSSDADIDALPYPEPQLFSTEPDVHRFYARVLRAFLQLFSYPGLTTCRCEMEAELHTGLLLYSFFDWFTTMTYSSSVHERFSSIRIFNRNSDPKWTTDGFSPIAFLPLPLKSINMEMQFGKSFQKGRFNDREIPDFLVPLVTSIQPALNALMIHEIAKWKKKWEKVKVKIPFEIPDWLFIHGIVYDAIEIQLYTCAPRVTKCNADGMPLKWEFACLPMDAFYLHIYDDRSPSQRLNGVVMLLKIRRHTIRIAKALEELRSDSRECGLAALCESAMLEEESREKGPLDVFGSQEKRDINDNGMQDRAAECLKNCMNRAGLWSLPHETDTNWMFFDTRGKPVPREVQKFLSEFLNNWRPPSGLLSLPEDWLKPSVDLTLVDLTYVPPWMFLSTEPQQQMRIFISPHITNFITLSEEEVLSRHSDPESFAPDFLLAVPARKHRDKYRGTISIDDLSPSTLHSLEHFNDIAQYMCHEIDAKAGISGLFKCIPGCWLRCDPQSRFPSVLATTQDPIDFALLLHPIQTVPIQMQPLTPDVMLRNTMLNPALIIGIQGPTPWPDEFACLPSASQSRPKNKTDALLKLAKVLEPSLKTHLINWQLRFEQGLTPSKKLPPWFMLFGIIYDAREVNIVAHIPVMDDAPQYSFISYIVDTIPFSLATPSSKVSESWYLDRFRVAYALLSVQKHAFRMAALWECVAWPDAIVSWEEILEREHLGPVLTPSERGYMVEPHPMAQLYRKMHGSDETIDDDTISMNDVDNSSDYVENHVDFEAKGYGGEDGHGAVTRATEYHNISQKETEEAKSCNDPWRERIESWRMGIYAGSV